MWKFDEKHYLERVLDPAVAVFKAEARLPDVFERYHLPLHVDDDDDIRLAIDTVTDFWNKRRENSFYKPLIAALIERKEHARTRRELLDENMRGMLRQDVERQRMERAAGRLRVVDETIALVAAKGHVTPPEVAALMARFQPDGFTADEVQSRLRVPVREVPSRLPENEGLPLTVRNRIQANLAVLGKRSLFDFLGVEADATAEKLALRYRECESEWRPRPVDHRKTAANDLLGLVKLHLIDGDPALYRASLSWDAIERLRREVQIPAADKVIDHRELRALLVFASGLGLPEDVALRYILEIAKDPRIGASVEVSSSLDGVRCAGCQSLMPRDRTACGVCGDGLWRPCSRCRDRIPASASECWKCGIAVGEEARVEMLLRRAELCLRDGQLVEARAAAREAESLAGPGGPVDRVMGRIEDYALKVRRLEVAIEKRLLVDAEGILSELVAHHAAAGLPAVLQRAKSKMENALAQARSHMERARKHERAGNDEGVVEACLEALEVCADLRDAQRMLHRYPPLPPTELHVVAESGRVMLRWQLSPSPGDITHGIVRREGRAPVASNDGVTLTRTDGTSFTDDTAKPGSFVFYGVFAERAGTVSAVCSAPGVLVATEVSTFRLEAGDNVVTGRWDLPPAGRIRVFRSGGHAVHPGAETEIPLADAASFIDMQVINGHRYSYRAVLELQVPLGQTVSTPGVVLNAEPETAPAPVEDLRVDAIRGGAHLLRWTRPSRGDVRVYRCTSPVSWVPRSEVTVRELAPLGPALSGQSASSAVDSAPADWGCYLPVTIVRDRAIIGVVRRYVVDVTDLKAEDHGAYMLLRWVWPRQCGQVRVAWREDRFPDDARDPVAASMIVTAGEYRIRNGVRFQKTPRPQLVTVFAQVLVFDQMVLAPGRSPGARQVIPGYDAGAPNLASRVIGAAQSLIDVVSAGASAAPRAASDVDDDTERRFRSLEDDEMRKGAR